ncbi:MAG TPA: homoserine kinase [Dehalococcoidia bacterium]
MKLTIRTPATSANLGPGFDCLGIALDIWAEVRVETVSSAGRAEGAARLVEQGINAAFEGVGLPPPVSISWDNGLPLARGLGGSASLRAAGLLAGNALLDGLHNEDALLQLGTRLEGHPDNMAPTLFGGLQVSLLGSNRMPLHIAAPVPGDLSVVVFVPDFEMPTQEGRRRIARTTFTREDAVANFGRIALLLAALNAGRYDLLDEATQDRYHQPVRGEIFPGLAPIMAAAKDAGAAASYLSGGGSTVAAFMQGEAPAERVARMMTLAATSHGFSGRSIITSPSARGAYVAAQS